jgi:hypothetical protein
MRARIDLREEQGTTLVELMVGMAAGMVVLSALTLVIVVTLHGSARVSARVEATQNGRIAVTNLMEELHSACVAPKVAPVLEKSTGTRLIFIHAERGQGAAVAPNPTKSEVVLENGTLTQYDRVATGGTAPNWTFSGTTTSRRLMTNVGPISGSSSIFSYFAYQNGALATVLPNPELTSTQASSVIDVQVALTAAPGRTPVADAGASSSVQDSAMLRLTPPSFNEQAVSLPCQ